MALDMGRIVVVVVVALTMSVRGVLMAAVYVVGEGCSKPEWSDSIYCDYNLWAVQYYFVVGDTIIFNFDPLVSTVAQVTKAQYDGCLIESVPSVNEEYESDISPTNVTFSTTGSYYFANTRSYCNNQRLAIYVNPYSSSSSSSSRKSKTKSNDSTVKTLVGSIVARILIIANMSLIVYCVLHRRQRLRMISAPSINEATPVLLAHDPTQDLMDVEGDYVQQGVHINDSRL